MADNLPDDMTAEALTEEPMETGSPFAALEPAENSTDTLFGDELDTAGVPGRLNLVYDVPVSLSVELGRTDIAIRDVVNLGRGSIIELDRGPSTPLDVRINGVLIGRGEVVLINSETLGLRFTEVVTPTEPGKR
jgi:flagellar motor switch protein FliN